MKINSMFLTSFAAIAVGAVLMGASPKDGTAIFSKEDMEQIAKLSPVPKLPEDKTNRYADNEKAALLGKSLFFDKRLSGAEDISCATCHDPQHGWRDGKALPKVFMDPHLDAAQKAGMGKRKVPSLWNLAYNQWFFWDGRSDSMWSQALGPFENPKEMEGGSRLQHAHVVYDDKDLRKQYEALFGQLPDLSKTARFPLKGCPQPDDPKGAFNSAWQSMSKEDQDAINRVYSNLGKSIAAYERRIVSRNSKFDVFAEGLKGSQADKLAVFNDHEKNGLKLFVGKAGCISCHSGPNFTDGSFHNLRVSSKTGSQDPGRFDGISQVKGNPFNTAGAYSDDPSGGKERLEGLKAKLINKGQLKTPGLRNIAMTGPYMHQGQMSTLKEVVNYYSTLNGAAPLAGPDEHLLVARHLSASEVDDLVSFLNALTDESATASLVPR
jgi:cytochrome c peroxidase